MAIILQPFDNMLGSTLKRKISSRFDRITIVSAFVRSAGVLGIKEELEQFRNNGGHVTIIVGVDMNGTSYEGLLSVIECSDEAYVVGFSNQSVIFHPKIYLMEGQDEVWAAVGSNNLTRGGLWSNVECYEEFEGNIVENKDRVSELNNIISRLKSEDYGSRRLDRNLVDLLRDLHYISSEEGRGGRKKHGDERGDSPFKPIQKAKGDEDTTLDDVLVMIPISEESMWFETGRVTGGSSNILDLSKTGIVIKGSTKGTFLELPDDPKHARGGVVFFGVDPESTESKEISIDYKGIIYYENVVKIHTGGKKPNLSWRLQLRGVSKDGVKLTTVLGESLKESIAIFERKEDDVFLLRLVSISYLDEVIALSQIAARNGRSPSGRRYGLLEQ